MTSKIKVLLLDIGNVLIKVNLKTSWERISPYLNQKNSPLNDPHHFFKTFFHSPLYYDFEMNKISPDEFFQHFMDQHQLQPLGIHDLKNIWNDCLLEPMPHIENTLTTLSEKIPLFGLSNTNQVHYDFFMNRYSFFNYFQKVYTSFELGLRKPDQKIYDKTFQSLQLLHLNLQRHEVLFIDDLSENIKSAADYGFTSAHLLPEMHSFSTILKQHSIL